MNKDTLAILKQKYHMFDKIKMMQQAWEMQKKLKAIIVTGEFRGVKITMNGKQDVLAVEITDDEILTDKNKLAGAIKDALNDAINKVQKEAAGQMQGDFAGLFGA